MVLAIDDVKAPEKIVDPTCAVTNGSNFAGLDSDKDAGHSRVSLSNSPRGQLYNYRLLRALHTRYS
jgi:hypothetical protein